MSERTPEDGKRVAAEAAAALVEDGMSVGLGTGSTVAYLLPALAGRGLNIRCVPSSPATEQAARSLGLTMEPFDASGAAHLDMAIDGADQVTPDLWLVKGRGGAHTREKIIAVAAERFVVIVDWTKLVDALGPPVPLELLSFGLSATVRRLSERGPVRMRDSAPTPDGNVLGDYEGVVTDPMELCSWLDAVPGVVGHGLFQPDLVHGVLVGRANGGVDRVTRR